MAKKNNCKYDSWVNIMGSVPNYNVMLDYISDTYGNTEAVLVPLSLGQRNPWNDLSLP